MNIKQKLYSSINIALLLILFPIVMLNFAHIVWGMPALEMFIGLSSWIVMIIPLWGVIFVVQIMIHFMKTTTHHP